jgi:hypothetical protein
MSAVSVDSPATAEPRADSPPPVDPGDGGGLTDLASKSAVPSDRAPAPSGHRTAAPASGDGVRSGADPLTEPTSGTGRDPEASAPVTSLLAALATDLRAVLACAPGERMSARGLVSAEVHAATGGRGTSAATGRAAAIVSASAPPESPVSPPPHQSPPSPPAPLGPAAGACAGGVAPGGGQQNQCGDDLAILSGGLANSLTLTAARVASAIAAQLPTSADDPGSRPG